MKSAARKEVVEEVRRFGRERDAIFDKTKASASRALAGELNADSVINYASKYLPLLFVRIGTRVVKDMMDEAKKAGRDHAERLLQARNINAEVQ